MTTPNRIYTALSTLGWILLALLYVAILAAAAFKDLLTNDSTTR